MIRGPSCAGPSVKQPATSLALPPFLLCYFLAATGADVAMKRPTEGAEPSHSLDWATTHRVHLVLAEVACPRVRLAVARGHRCRQLAVNFIEGAHSARRFLRRHEPAATRRACFNAPTHEQCTWNTLEHHAKDCNVQIGKQVFFFLSFSWIAAVLMCMDEGCVTRQDHNACVT